MTRSGAVCVPHCFSISAKCANGAASLLSLLSSKDMLSRWTYPIVPDSNLQEGDAYEHLRGQIYKDRDVTLSRSCILGKCVLIGTGTEVAENAQITNSVIGRRVRIGRSRIVLIP